MHPTPFALPYRGWEDAARVAREHFGVTAFRPGQRELVEAVLAGQDAVPRARRGGGRARSRLRGGRGRGARDRGAHADDVRGAVRAGGLVPTVRHGHFEWDTAKARANQRKHGVSFEEAATCFLDPYGLDVGDLVHAERLVLIAYAKTSRILTVVYAERGDGAILRLISARRATAHEKALYEDAS
jgi:uncharacterized DUF497 family protein